MKNHQLSGEEIGRLILKDLALIHKAARDGKEAASALTAEEKLELVGSISEPPEVAAYNEYRYFHEFLSRASLFFNLHLQSAEASFWQMKGNLGILHLAEQENEAFLKFLPRIMAPSEYEQSRNLFNPLGKQGFGLGVAVLEPSSLGGKIKLKGGAFQYPQALWRLPHMAEAFLKNSASWEAQLAGYRDTIREALVVKTTVELAARFLKVPELSHLIGEVDLSQVEHLNKLMAEIPPTICRRGFYQDEQPEEELKAALIKIFQSINIKNLKPTAKAKSNARRALDFSVARGNSEKIYAILRQEDQH